MAYLGGGGSGTPLCLKNEYNELNLKRQLSSFARMKCLSAPLGQNCNRLSPPPPPPTFRIGPEANCPPPPPAPHFRIGPEANCPPHTHTHTLFVWGLTLSTPLAEILDTPLECTLCAGGLVCVFVHLMVYLNPPPSLPPGSTLHHW